MKFAVLSDVHYISLDMIREKEYFERVNSKLHDTITLRHYLAKNAIKSVGDKDVDAVLLIGDLTDDGDEPSTREVVELLRELKGKGKKVYVLTATHDFHHNRVYCRKHPRNYIFTDEPWDSPYFDPDNFDYRSILRPQYSHLSDEDIKLHFEKAVFESAMWDTYAEFRPTEPISVCESEQSYCVELDDDTWCMMLYDCFRHSDAMYNESPSFSPTALEWIKSMIDLAKEKGKFIFACTHHSMVPPQPAYKIGANPRDMRDADVGHFLADMGLNLIFTGHSHMRDISFLSSDSGKMMCDITTPSCSMFPPQYRLVDLDGKNGKIKTEMVDMPMPQEMDFGGKTPYEVMKDDKINGIHYDLKDKNPALYKYIDKIERGLKVKHFAPLFRKPSKISRKEYKAIKNKGVFEIVYDCVSNLMTGDGEFTPDTTVYKVMMGTAASLDSIISAQPFFDLYKKLTKGYTVWDILQPLLFNNYIPAGNAEFDFTKMPEERLKIVKYKSNAGAVTMTLFWICAVILSPLAVPFALFGLPIILINQKKKGAKPSKLPERY